MPRIFDPQFWNTLTSAKPFLCARGNTLFGRALPFKDSSFFINAHLRLASHIYMQEAAPCSWQVSSIVDAPASLRIPTSAGCPWLCYSKPAVDWVTSTIQLQQLPRCLSSDFLEGYGCVPSSAFLFLVVAASVLGVTHWALRGRSVPSVSVVLEESGKMLVFFHVAQMSMLLCEKWHKHALLCVLCLLCRDLLKYSWFLGGEYGC